MSVSLSALSVFSGQTLARLDGASLVRDETRPDKIQCSHFPLTT
jgi:hypothetical protein